MEPVLAPPLVLVAEDDDDMRGLVRRHLEAIDDPKLEVITAEDGEEAWRLAKERLPDLVVLDVMMPGMSGWEVCKKIREDVALAHTGVVMLTGIGENLNQMTSPLYGADAFIDKPFEFDQLHQKVKEALDARASQRDAVPRPVRNGVNVSASSADDPAPESAAPGGNAAESDAPAEAYEEDEEEESVTADASEADEPRTPAANKTTKKRAAPRPAKAKASARPKKSPKTKQKSTSSSKRKATKMAAKKTTAKKGAAKKGAAKKGAAKRGSKKASSSSEE